MGKWVFRILVAVAIVGGLYYYLHGKDFSLRKASFLPAPAPGERTSSPAVAYKWQTLDEDSHSFRVDLPGTPDLQQVAVTREDGSLDSVPMLMTKPEEQESYAVVYGDNPPVVRVNAGAADKALDMARDGALRRTNTTLLNEERTNVNGYPARNIQAKSSNGTVMDALLTQIGSRLYMLIVINPSADVRKQADISRFFRSLSPSARANTIPEQLPAASFSGM